MWSTRDRQRDRSPVRQQAHARSLQIGGQDRRSWARQGEDRQPPGCAGNEDCGGLHDRYQAMCDRVAEVLGHDNRVQHLARGHDNTLGAGVDVCWPAEAFLVGGARVRQRLHVTPRVLVPCVEMRSRGRMTARSDLRRRADRGSRVLCHRGAPTERWSLDQWGGMWALSTRSIHRGQHVPVEPGLVDAVTGVVVPGLADRRARCRGLAGRVAPQRPATPHGVGPPAAAIATRQSGRERPERQHPHPARHERRRDARRRSGHGPTVATCQLGDSGYRATPPSWRGGCAYPRRPPRAGLWTPGGQGMVGAAPCPPGRSCVTTAWPDVVGGELVKRDRSPALPSCLASWKCSASMRMKPP